MSDNIKENRAFFAENVLRFLLFENALFFWCVFFESRWATSLDSSNLKKVSWVVKN